MVLQPRRDVPRTLQRAGSQSDLHRVVRRSAMASARSIN
jgi:hypothetical protein